MNKKRIFSIKNFIYNFSIIFIDFIGPYFLLSLLVDGTIGLFWAAVLFSLISENIIYGIILVGFLQSILFIFFINCGNKIYDKK